MQMLLPRLSCQSPALAAAAAAARVSSSVRLPTGAYRVSAHITLGWVATPSILLRGLAGGRAVSSRVAATEEQQQQQLQQLHTAEDVFYAEDAATFGDLGLTAAVVEALQGAGFVRPSRVQELVIPTVLSGKDIVLAAETGSGKTLAYIAPLASVLLQRAETGQQPPSPDLLRDSSAQRSSSSKPKPRPQLRWMGLVLCPNTALCHQVVRLVSSLTSAGGQPILRAAHVSSSSPPPFELPDIVVTTPGALKTLFNDRGAMYSSLWTAEAVSARSAVVVVDEADLLWQGGYVKDLTRLLDAFKSAERRVMEAQVAQELGLDKACLDRLPRTVREACWKGGVPAMLKAGLTQVKIQRLRQEQQLQQPDSQHQGSQQQQVAGDASDEAEPASSSGNSSAANTDRIQSSQDASTSSSSSLGTYGPYFRRQHLFVAATMPSLTKGDVGAELQKRFKGAQWVSGDMLHQVKPHVQHTWVRVDQEGSTLDQGLLAAIRADPDYQADKARVLVFTRNTASADRVSAFLHDHDIPNNVYHKNISNQDQAAALSAMAHPEPGHSLVMVSTDAAARGIDLPEITHVIQADFVANAIEFLHRVGRTARAGRAGKVTSLYGPADRVLAEALRKYVEAGEPVEDCFSRNRSFSRKLKRYGKFVPRGQEGPQ